MHTYLSVFVFSVGRVVGPLVRFDPGVFQDSGQSVESRPFLDASLDAVVTVGRLRTGSRTPYQRDHLHFCAALSSREQRCGINELHVKASTTSLRLKEIVIKN